MTLLLQAVLLSMLGCIVRPHEPAEFYNEGQQKKVQSAQLVAVITGLIGGLGPIIAVLLKQKVLTPVEYVVTLYSSFASRDEAIE